MPAVRQPFDADNLRVVIEFAVARQGFLAEVRRLGLAVSGGADSMALFHLLLPLCHQAGVIPVVLHFNHGLRGEAAAEDLQFVRRVAEEAGVTFRSAEGVLQIGSGRSLEMAAREARLDFFFASASAESLDAIATGHQADDVAEALLLRLARGAGSTGLAGLRPSSLMQRRGQRLRFVRPLLGCSRERLQTWLREAGLPWREDASNRDTGIARNAVRYELLPHLVAHFDADIVAQLAQSADILRCEDDFLDSLTHEWLARQRLLVEPTAAYGALPAAALAEVPLALQRRIIRAWLIGQGLSVAAGFAPVAALLARLERPTPWQLTLPGGHLARCQDDRLRIEPVPQPASDPLEKARTLSVPGCVSWGPLTVSASLAPGIMRQRGAIGLYPAACSLDTEAVGTHPLTLRRRQPGDCIAPLGMSGTRRVQDIFVDAKVPQAERDAIPLLCCGETVVWIPGYRVARAFAVRHEMAPAIQIRITV